jgi:hypothetical protein
MANPNIVNVSSIYGGTTYYTPTGTTAVVLLPNAAASGTIIKVNSIIATNVNGYSPVTATVVPKIFCTNGAKTSETV